MSDGLKYAYGRAYPSNLDGLEDFQMAKMDTGPER